ncbi:FAD-dependent oxidoreductase [Pseudonocardia sp. WMMC193]|uniref:FAD-dependent oxidoreductase n=1 Tax=Pseudonocardia sp. WMMC193 TaxID=2911965 RepID=UPI001F31C4BF|nr:FAD-dependent oxidoreductase [Pseudonocardia sp. WMMC193]MCF7548306.1 FAD-dependent oxidoreductase [Pseudonocardia sp. WMMC193]
MPASPTPPASGGAVPQTRIAVIGAGPSGLYAAAALLASESPVDVDVIDRLPAPYGLVRYGVAPDHVKMKSVIRVLQRPFSDGSRVRFLGNVRVGEGGVPLDVLKEHYHAVIHASGSSVDRALGIPGEELPGSYGSGAFVSWYCGHPDHVDLDPVLDHTGVVVVGAGNVALDVARVLARGHVEMAATDVPDRVLDALRGSGVEDVHVVVRRGPEHVKFTPAELRQIGELAGVQVLVHGYTEPAEEPAERRQKQNLAMLAEWAADPGPARPRRIHLHFHRTPVRLLGEGRVTGMVVEPTGGGAEETLDAGLVVRAIGYLGEPIPGLPYDGGIVPNTAGRVEPGTYVTGWIKRGPTGVIGTNKGDAVETVASLLDDLHTLPTPPHPDPDSVVAVLEAYGVEPVTWTDWERLDAEEVRRGGARDAERVKVADLQDMLAAARGRSRVS